MSNYQLFINHYYCTDCDIAWKLEYDCICDDKCPGCDAITAPEKIESKNTKKEGD